MIYDVTAGIGSRLSRTLRYFGGIYLLLLKSIHEFMSKPIYFDLTVQQVYHIGTRSLPLVLVTSAAIGMVMTLQFGLGLQKFGGTLYVPRIVSVSLVRELSPVFTGLMIAGRVGAGIASELGSMSVTQQIDAIRALGTSPIKKIVIPRILGTVIALPLLTVFSNVVGMLGGIFIGATELNLTPEFYLNKIITTVTLLDYMSGLVKAFCFAFIISLSGCYYGLQVREGTRDVGGATTRTVVMSSILVLIVDFFLTKIFFMWDKWS